MTEEELTELADLFQGLPSSDLPLIAAAELALDIPALIAEVRRLQGWTAVAVRMEEERNQAANRVGVLEGNVRHYRSELLRIEGQLDETTRQRNALAEEVAALQESLKSYAYRYTDLLNSLS